jgi:hypothetical protein
MVGQAVEFAQDAHVVPGAAARSDDAGARAFQPKQYQCGHAAIGRAVARFDEVDRTCGIDLALIGFQEIAVGLN